MFFNIDRHNTLKYQNSKLNGPYFILTYCKFGNEVWFYIKLCNDQLKYMYFILLILPFVCLVEPEITQ